MEKDIFVADGVLMVFRVTQLLVDMMHSVIHESNVQ